MFDQIFTSPVDVARYRTGPLLEERLAFLAHLANQGYTRRSLQKNARDLLAIAQMLGLTGRPRKALTLDEVKRKMAKQRCLALSACRPMAPIHGASATATRSAHSLGEEDQSVR